MIIKYGYIFEVTKYMAPTHIHFSVTRLTEECVMWGDTRNSNDTVDGGNELTLSGHMMLGGGMGGTDTT